MSDVHVGIMGAGSIGCYLGGALLAARAADVSFVGRDRVGRELAAHGLTVQDFGADGATVAPDRIRYATDASALAACDAVLCCVKSAHTGEAGRALAGALPPGALVVSMQNGLRNADTLRACMPEGIALAGIVGFNVVGRGDGVYRRTTSGPLTVQASADARWRATADALRAAGLDVVERADIAPDQWTKLLVNLNNAVSALSGAPTRELIANAAYRRIVAAVVGEGLDVLRAAGIRPAKLRGVPVEWMPRLMRLPTWLLRLVAGAQLRVDPEARSSMWEDLTRGRATEVDYLNGEIVALAGRAGVDAPLNRRIVDLARDAERAGAGTPNLSAADLWAELTAG